MDSACPRIRGKDMSNIEEAYEREKREREEAEALQRQQQQPQNGSALTQDAAHTANTAAGQNDGIETEQAVDSLARAACLYC